MLQDACLCLEFLLFSRFLEVSTYPPRCGLVYIGFRDICLAECNRLNLSAFFVGQPRLVSSFR